MQPRRGVTLFQMLVVLAFLLMLLAFLLPAVAKVRQAASRANSQNNLKQIAIACHNYHDSNGILPPGVDSNHFSVAAMILPYIEQDNLYKQLDFKKPCDDKANAQVRGAIIKVYVSPSDPLPLPGDVGPTNYLFNAGSQTSLTNNNGVFYLDSKIKLQQIPDGTSNTLMAGETLRGDRMKKAVTVSRQHVLLKSAALKNLKDNTGVDDFKNNQNIAGDRGGAWIDGRFLMGTFTGTRVLNDSKPDVSCGGEGGLSGLRSVNPYTNILMCDGSVRVITNTVKLDVWQKLTDRQDGEVLPQF